MKIIEKTVDELIPYINNARTHNDEQVTQIASSIKEFGFNNPILLDGENGVIAGHGRLLAAKKLGLEKVPCIELKHLTDKQKKAFILADNKIALNAGWNEELLKIELEDLEDFDMSQFGFDKIEKDLAIDIPDYFDEEKAGKNKTQNYLEFCGKKIPMDDEEVTMLNKVYDDYLKDNGVVYGFVRSLVK